MKIRTLKHGRAGGRLGERTDDGLAIRRSLLDRCRQCIHDRSVEPDDHGTQTGATLTMRLTRNSRHFAKAAER